MPKFCPLEELFLPLYQAGTSVVLGVGRLPVFVMLPIYLSFLATITANLLSFKADKKATGYSHVYEICLDSAVLLSVLYQVAMTNSNGKNLTVIVAHLLEPFKKYPKRSAQFKLIRQHKTRIATCALAMSTFNVVGVFFHCLNPLVTVFRSSNQADPIEVWPLPFGKVTMKVYYVWFYGVCYLLSLCCVLISSVTFVCWFVILVCSTDQIVTKLKLLSLEVKALSVRAEELCEHRLSFISREKRSKMPRQEIVNIYSLQCLKEVTEGHIKIIRHLRLLENSYRWIVLGFSKIAISITALALMIMIDEWKLNGSVSPVTANTALCSLFFIFVNSHCGQIIINESESLRVALCGISWIERTTRFTNSLKIMMTATQKPLRLTAGTVYTIGMESYSKTMEAVYSFVNFLIPLRR